MGIERSHRASKAAGLWRAAGEATIQMSFPNRKIIALDEPIGRVHVARAANSR